MTNSSSMKKGKKEEVIRFAEVTEYVDESTGELIAQKKFKSYKVGKEPPHVKIYLEDIAAINHLPPAASKVLNLLIQHMGYNNMVPMLKPFKEMICASLDIKMNTLEKVTRNLVEAGILHKYARGLYLLDPHLFAKGRWENIENLRLIIEYDEKGKRRLISNAPEKLKQLSIKFD